MTPKKKLEIYVYIKEEFKGVSKVSYFEYFNLKVYTTFNHGP